jgi:clan AA aspartic protease
MDELIIEGRATTCYTYSMGEIRETVRLTNVADTLARTRSGKKKTRSIEVEAVVDTGAVMSVIPIHIVQKLGLTIRTRRMAKYADGRTEEVGVTSAVLFEMQGRDTVEEALVFGDEVLIGQTVLEKLDLLADCAGRRLVPHPDRPNQPVAVIR